MNTDELIKKQTNWIKAVFGALAAIVAALVIFGALLVPKISKAVDAVDHSLNEINVLIQDADEAVQNINKVDFDNLKQSIDDLSGITAFLANIFGNSKN
jgi:predicted PurR-regulated permease PerM